MEGSREEIKPSKGQWGARGKRGIEKVCGGHGLGMGVLHVLDTLSSHKVRNGRREGGREAVDG